MALVKLSHWEFSFGGCHPALKGTPHYAEPEILTFNESLDLLLHLAADRSRESSIQNQVQRRLKDDAVAKQWHSSRSKFKDQPHFSKYRETAHYQQYHDAARAVSAGTQTPDQQAMADGLNADIGSSAICVPAGQLVFHGRADLDLHILQPYPSFISTSLDPTVAIYHAVKRGQKSASRPVVYMLTLTAPLRAIWGNGGSLNEWELLLASGLTCNHVQTISGVLFDIVEATIGP